MTYVHGRVAWHDILTPTRMFNTYRTLCRLTFTTTDVVNTVPEGERHCRNCRRSAEKRAKNG